MLNSLNVALLRRDPLQSAFDCARIHQQGDLAVLFRVGRGEASAQGVVCEGKLLVREMFRLIVIFTVNHVHVLPLIDLHPTICFVL